MGIGPEVVVKALRRLARHAACRVYGQRSVLEQAARLSGLSLPPSVDIIEPELQIPLGKPNKRQCGQASLEYIRRAVETVGAGDCDAIVTGPICKENIHAAGSPYPGHTEMLAGLAGIRSNTYLMMVGPKLRVTLVTLHRAISEVPRLITRQSVLEAIVLTHDVLRRHFKIQRPRLAVAGLNPHAGEGGLFGDEEVCTIIPAVKAARRRHINVTGPVPGDTVYVQAVRGAFDAVISMYHDQGLIPIKLLHFEEAVNMTLGLPFIRTSVDHGVGYDIAWQNKANPASMIAAGKLAIQMVKK